MWKCFVEVCDQATFKSVIADNVVFAKRDAKRAAILTAIEPADDNAPQPTQKSSEQRVWLLAMVKDNVMFMHLSDEQRLDVIDAM